jgi:hypothetical protein
MLKIWSGDAGRECGQNDQAARETSDHVPRTDFMRQRGLRLSHDESLTFSPQSVRGSGHGSVLVDQAKLSQHMA